MLVRETDNLRAKSHEQPPSPPDLYKEPTDADMPRKLNPAIPEARRHLRRKITRWTQALDAFYRKVDAIEAEPLRWAVRAIIKSILSGHGEFHIRGSKGKNTHLRVTNLDLDDSAVDLILDQLQRAGVNAEETIDRAGIFLLTTVQGSELDFLGWAFRHLHFEAGDNVNAVHDRIIYNPSAARIVGVVSKFDPDQKLIVPPVMLNRLLDKDGGDRAPLSVRCLDLLVPNQQAKSHKGG